MGKAAEARDEVAMMPRPRRVGLAEPRHQGDAPFLIGQQFGMAERQVEEHGKVERCAAVVTGGDGLCRRGAGRRVGVVHARRVAEGIARVLVKQQHQGKRGLRVGQPVGETATGGGLVPVEESLAKDAVEAVVLGEPHRGAPRGPEIDNGNGFGDGRSSGHGVHGAYVGPCRRGRKNAQNCAIGTVLYLPGCNMKASDLEGRCPIDLSLEVIGGKWKPIILYRLGSGRLRFGELQRAVPRATQRMLTLQLRELERDGMLIRTVYAEVPPRVEYALTEPARRLLPILEAMGHWLLDNHADIRPEDKRNSAALPNENAPAGRRA